MCLQRVQQLAGRLVGHFDCLIGNSIDANRLHLDSLVLGAFRRMHTCMPLLTSTIKYCVTLSVPFYICQFRMYGAKVVYACPGFNWDGSYVKQIQHSLVVGILRIWTFDVDCITENSSAHNCLTTVGSLL